MIKQKNKNSTFLSMTKLPFRYFSHSHFTMCLDLESNMCDSKPSNVNHCHQFTVPQKLCVTKQKVFSALAQQLCPTCCKFS